MFIHHIYHLCWPTPCPQSESIEIGMYHIFMYTYFGTYESCKLLALVTDFCPSRYVASVVTPSYTAGATIGTIISYNANIMGFYTHLKHFNVISSAINKLPIMKLTTQWVFIHHLYYFFLTLYAFMCGHVVNTKRVKHYQCQREISLLSRSLESKNNQHLTQNSWITFHHSAHLIQAHAIYCNLNANICSSCTSYFISVHILKCIWIVVVTCLHHRLYLPMLCCMCSESQWHSGWHSQDHNNL